MKSFYYIAAVLWLLCGLISSQSLSVGTNELSKGYHDYESLTRNLKRLASINPRITKLESIGNSFQNRDLWMLRISGINGKDPLSKQALLICANLEADHLIGSEVILNMAERLIMGYEKDEHITKVLDARTIYFIPRVNPDGAELFFQTPLREYSGNLKPRDNDYDWKMDEDGPEDLNGDGFITLMRIKDKKGTWTVDQNDHRLMLKKNPDTPLDQLYSLYLEGIDNDGDDLFNEDGPGGFNLNRNFPHNFGYQPKGIGVYAASESETRALIEFMNAFVPESNTQPHGNICAVLVFSKYDNLASEAGIQSGTPTFPSPFPTDNIPSVMSSAMMTHGEPPARSQGSLRDPQPKQTLKADLQIFERISRQYQHFTGIQTTFSEKPVGSFLEYAYFQYGVPAFSANLWSLRADSLKNPGDESSPPPLAVNQKASLRPRPSRLNPESQGNDHDAEWLNWIDQKNNGEGFIPWSKFRHEQLGEVEIGGFQPHIRLTPPAEQIADLSRSHLDFVLFLAEQFAEIEMDGPQVNKLSSRAYELKVTVRNRGHFPYVSEMGIRSKNRSPIMVRLKFADEDTKLFGGFKRVDIRNLAAGEEKELRWTIISPSGKKVQLEMWARHGGGRVSETVVLN